MTILGWRGLSIVDLTPYNQEIVPHLEAHYGSLLPAGWTFRGSSSKIGFRSGSQCYSPTSGSLWPLSGYAYYASSGVAVDEG